MHQQMVPLIGKIKTGNEEDYEKIIPIAEDAFKIWRMIPAPKRGGDCSLIGDELRNIKSR
jgi:aldehyde dehydrogenase (NAD+)